MEVWRPCGIMAKLLPFGLVLTEFKLVSLLRSLFDKYPPEKYEPVIP